MKTNYYSLLGVKSTSSMEDIKKAYRSKAKTYHPDNQKSGDEDKFKLLQEAYATLSDPDKKYNYDLKNGFKVNRTSYENMSNNWKNDVYNSFVKNAKKKGSNIKNPLYKEISVKAELSDVYNGLVRKFTMGSGSKAKDINISFPIRKNKFTTEVTTAEYKLIKLLVTVDIPVINEWDKKISIVDNNIIVDLIINSYSKTIEVNLEFLNQNIRFNKPKSNKKGLFMTLPEQGLINDNGEVGDVYINLV